MDEQWPPAHQQLLRSLADGDRQEVVAQAEEVRRSDPVVADLTLTDAAAQVGQASLSDLGDLQAQVQDRAPDRPLLRWWCLAILGERAFLDADLGAIPLAAQALHEMPTDPFPAPPLLYVRGRLRRIASAVYLTTPSARGIAEHRRLRDEAVTDFLRGGFDAEAALTRALSATLHAIATWDDVLEDQEVVKDARALLGDRNGSTWVPLIDYLQALVALTAGDMDDLDHAIARVDQHRHLHPVLAELADVGRAQHGLIASGGDPAAVAALEEATAALQRTHPQLLHLTCLNTANLLADTGCVAAARRFALTGLHWPPTSQIMVVMGDLVRARIEVLDGADLSDAKVPVLLDRLEELGLRRRAGAVALRMSRDLGRLGDVAAADQLRAWGLERMPPPRRRTRWEQLWSEPVVVDPPSPQPGPEVAVARPGTAPPAGTAGPPVTVTVMAPILRVEAAGRAVELRTMAAKLLLALVVTHPDPLHVEQAVDVLWPEAGPDVGRQRLNTVVHRLRSSLGAGPDIVRRTGDVLVLGADGSWDVDLLRWRRLIRGNPAAQAEALARAAGNLCHVQFPYDDLFLEHRRVLAADAARAIEAATRVVGDVDRTASDAVDLDRARRVFG